jgi:chorismate synthase
VAAGAIIQSALEKKGIYVGTHIKSCAGINDRGFSSYVEDIKSLHVSQFAILDNEVSRKMIQRTSEIKANDDSVGGIMETAIVGVPAGVGEPWFDSLEGMLSHAMFSIPAVKGIEFGAGFKCAEMMGSQMNDEFYVVGDSIQTRSNNNGGINGGISNGMPIVFSCVVKPTSSIARKQKTVNFINKVDTEIEIAGRHDATIIPRACVVAEALSAIVIADMLLGRYGTDYLLQ